MIHEVYRITSVRVNASGTRAVALATWDQRVVPSRLDGKPLGNAVSLHERARVELHRFPSSGAFYVWKVTLLK